MYFYRESIFNYIFWQLGNTVESKLEVHAPVVLGGKDTHVCSTGICASVFYACTLDSQSKLGVVVCYVHVHVRQ